MDNIKNAPNGGKFSAATILHLSAPNDLNALSKWDIDFRQIDKGAMKTTVKTRSSQKMSLLDLEMSKAVHQIGVSPKGQISIGLPIPHALSSWQGQTMENSGFVSFGSAQEFDGVGRGAFRGQTISIDEPEMERLARMLGIDLPDALRRSTKFAPSASPKSVTALYELAGRIMRADSLALSRQDEENVITQVLIAATSSATTEDKSSPAARSRAVRKAIEMMIFSEDQNLPLSEICSEIDVSLRTLDRAFSEEFGIAPKQYYLRLRLNRVRADLSDPREDSSISDIANKWGYWHLGQFAKDYQKMFDMLPSETRDRLN